MENFIHPFNVKAWLLATLLERVDGQDMSVGELRRKLGAFDRTVAAIPAIDSINAGIIKS